MPWQLKHCRLYRGDHHVQQFESVVLSQKTGLFFFFSSEETMKIRKPRAIITNLFPITKEQSSLGKTVSSAFDLIYVYPI